MSGRHGGRVGTGKNGGVKGIVGNLWLSETLHRTCRTVFLVVRRSVWESYGPVTDRLSFVRVCVRFSWVGGLRVCVIWESDGFMLCSEQVGRGGFIWRGMIHKMISVLLARSTSLLILQVPRSFNRRIGQSSWWISPVSCMRACATFVWFLDHRHLIVLCKYNLGYGGFEFEFEFECEGLGIV